MTSYKNKQNGVALVTVLFLFAIVMVVVSALINRTQDDINRTSHYLAAEQARLLSLSGEEYARQLLIEDLKLGSSIDHMGEKWAQEGLMKTFEGGYFEVSIEDAQAKININNIVKAGKSDPVMKEALASVLDFGLDDKQLSKTLADQAVDWIDTDKTGGTEEFDYLNEKIPYRPPNLSVGSATEFFWLKDMTPERIYLVHDLVSKSLISLPSGTLINVNTISPEALAGLAGITVDSAQIMVATIRKNKQGYSNVNAALSLLSSGLKQNIQAYLSVKTDYFQVKIRAKYADQYVYLVTLMKRDGAANGGKGELELISRDWSQRFLFPFSKDYNDPLDNNDFKLGR